MIELIDVQKRFGYKTIFSDINLRLPDYGLYLLEGPNGSGKSTLLSMIFGIDFDYEGTIRINGQTVSKKNRRRLEESSIALITQKPLLFDEYDVLDNILLPYQSRDKERALTILDKLGISAISHAFPETLSDGEKLRVSFARALFKNPSILLCDEVTSGLDPKNTLEANTLLKELAESALVIFATHKEEDDRFFDGYPRLLFSNGQLALKEERRIINEPKDYILDAKTKTKPSLFFSLLNKLMVPWMAFFLILSTLGSLGVFAYGKNGSDPSFNEDYLFDNYPYLVIQSGDLFQSGLPLTEDSFIPSFDGVRLSDSSSSYGEVKCLSLISIKSSLDKNFLPAISIGKWAEKDNDLVISLSRFSALEETLGVTGDDEKALEEVQTKWDSILAGNSTAYSLVGVYQDVEERNVSAKKQLLSQMGRTDLSYDPKRVYAVLDYGISSAFTFISSNEPIKQYVGFYPTDSERSRLRNQTGYTYENLGEENPYLSKDGQEYPAIAQKDVASSRLLLSELLFVFAFVSSVLFGLFMFLQLRRRIAFYRAINPDSRSLYEYFVKRTLLGVAFQAAIGLIILAIGGPILEMVFESTILLDSSIVFIDLSWRPFVLLTIVYLAQLLFLLISIRLLFRGNIQKEIRENQ
ncbi:MAG: ATP-binding cassette domain-containing protein [Bacilli bacterium]|jgi:ABC-type multidrug transport system ATPase subunit|nr:ATP-binding cassette domain-containing protein [Bacilli bacterium]MCH4210419.1 ATP-binding cassette domain-containing protein [Bacilli bacterium]MCH4228831.1 ATP-binding cassette domain-containing protein [Bacilli bacterium]MCH4278301.1 ATP-binding cassette domain-containing protein [Bacilli bacterium]MCI2055031.1 ATP-binding cassette domain-containing protein [Bacilli bacterium]